MVNSKKKSYQDEGSLDSEEIVDEKLQEEPSVDGDVEEGDEVLDEGLPEMMDVDVTSMGGSASSSSLKDKVSSSQVESLTIALADEKDKVLRLLADFENFKKRKQRELEDNRSRASEVFLKQLLPFIDDYFLACEHASSEKDQLSDVIQGFLLIKKKLELALEKSNVETFAKVGDPFDPNEHQAVANESVEGMKEGLVVKVLQHGFRIGKFVVRPAMVVVSL